MKQLKLKSRLFLSEDGRVVTEAQITKAILSLPQNKKLKLSAGWHSLKEFGCVGPKPELQPGEYGEYICVQNEWVFIPA